MTIHIEIGPDTCPSTARPTIARAVRTVLAHQAVDPASEVSIVITDEAQLHELNRQFRAVDAPTDVLSFPAEFSHPESGVAYLGDVLIAYPRVVAQARQGGHRPEDELQLLVVHGVLHLLGHDHATDEEKAIMWAAQAEILASLNVNINIPHS